MAREGAIVLLRVYSDTAVDPDVKKESVTFTRPVKVEAVKLIGGNPADADGDTLAVDVSYSTDGFVSSDVEIAAVAAAEYNDTDDDLLGGIGTRKAINVPLTAASQGADGTVRVPANAVIEGTLTWTGAPADGKAELIVLGHVL